MKKQIILIDDDRAYLDILSRRLNKLDEYAAHTYESATAALQAPALETHAIVLDLMLEDETGLANIEALKAHFSPTHLIILTGYASIATTVEAMRRGATDYLSKPVGFKELVARFSSAEESTPKHSADNEDLKPMTPAQVEWEYIQRMLQAHDGNISATATALGMHRRSLQRKLSKFSPSKK